MACNEKEFKQIKARPKSRINQRHDAQNFNWYSEQLIKPEKSNLATIYTDSEMSVNDRHFH